MLRITHDLVQASPLAPWGRGDSRSDRSGKIVPFFAVLLPVLCGMVGLVVDTGLLLASQRQVQNAADSGAAAAALRLLQGYSSAIATSDASTFVTSYNGLTNATVTVNIGPTQGNYVGNTNYVEVIVTNTTKTAFLKALGISGSTVKGRAVAGYESTASQYSEAIVLQDSNNITGANGLVVPDGSSLTVNGSLVVNAPGGGVDQYGQSISSSAPAIKLNHSGAISASYLQSNGGVDSAANITNTTTGGSMPLVTSVAAISDPLDSVPTPGPWNVSSISNWSSLGSYTINGTTTLNPGVYTNIQINSGANVTFNPGVYVFVPSGGGQGLNITGNATVTGNGVMFYFTGSDYYSLFTGYYDWKDGTVDLAGGKLPSAPDSGVTYSRLNINANGATINLTGLNDSSSSFDNILFFLRRRNQQTAQISNGGSTGALNLTGTLYAKWAQVQLGSGTYSMQMVVGSMQLQGGSTVTISSPSSSGTTSWLSLGSAQQVYVVE